jgi:DNA repair exonuclease SbcCD ATPase subunit|tara:strand:- start:3903 stop:5615 length:1713 start_codon:yes stop_codon:yes gene_type:complete
MIIFEKISWKNFLSTGNQPTEVILNDKPTTLIMGTNGAGKSTILDALTFSLYGKSFRKINKSQLVNSTNDKDCFVEIEFTTGGYSWKVQRGIKPNIFKIYKNGQELDQYSSAVEQQKVLEQSVLKMNYKSFTQIVILGSSTFVPFMQLPAAGRREVVEDLLDIKIFSSMNNIIKDKIKCIKDDVRTLELKRESLKDKVEMQSNFIRKIENQSKSDIDKKRELIKSYEVNIQEKYQNGFQMENEMSDLKNRMNEFSDATKRLREMGGIKGKLSQRITKLVGDHKFFSENMVCPTCGQDIEESFRVNRIKDSQDKAEELRKGFNELQQAIKDEELRESKFSKLSDEVSSTLNGISSNNTEISGLQKQVSRLESEIQTITTEIKNQSIEHEKLETFKVSLENTYKELSEKKESISYHDFTYSLLKDGGVKAKIVKKYLPLINQQVNKYLQMMDFYINFKLDEEFNETIESPIHEDFSYSSFSEGEKSRIDLALIFAWREVAKFKNSVNTNLMLFDEVFDSSLDGFGTEEFLKIIRFVIKDANIFVISHKADMHDKFASVIRYEKVKGFSVKYE